MSAMKTMDGYDPSKKRNQAKILIDINLIPARPEIVGKDIPQYVRRERLSYEDRAHIYRKGYTSCVGLIDSLGLYGIPVFVKFTGFKKCDYRKGWIDEHGCIVPEGTAGAYQ